MQIELQTVKKIAADVLYIEDPSTISDNAPLGQYGFNSIDYIDLCFEFKGQISDKITPENLWPFDAMVTKEEYFDGQAWTPAGWRKICDILEIDTASDQVMVQDLVNYFTPAVLTRRVTQIVNA